MQMVTGYREGSIETRGLTLHYLEWGDPASSPLVLLHGLTGHAHIWDHMAPALAERYRVLAPDQRGHGDSSAAASYETPDFVADTESLVEAWGLTRFDLVGLSMGGHNAMAYAGAHADRVRTLCLIDIPPAIDRTRAPNWEAISRLAETGHVRYADFEEAVRAARAGNPTAPDENLRYRTMCNLRPGSGGTLVLKYDHRAPAGWRPADLWPLVPRLTMPVLIVRGGLTNVLSRKEAERMAREFPNAELVEVGDSGHSVPTDRPEKLAPLLLDWLATQR